jgi:hypothetical protein
MTSSGKATLGPPIPSESGLTNVTVTTSSNALHGGGSAAGGQPHLAPRESNNPHLEMVKRKPAEQSGSLRPQPNRSRSRAKRRFSGSTNAGSAHSPGSDRGFGSKEREEGQSTGAPCRTRQRSSHSETISNVPQAKPAPWGVIGVCALDVKARSKPSKSILMKLIANREFDVKVFGDKVILDESKLCTHLREKFSSCYAN